MHQEDNGNQELGRNVEGEKYCMSEVEGGRMERTGILHFEMVVPKNLLLTKDDRTNTKNTNNTRK